MRGLAAGKRSKIDEPLIRLHQTTLKVILEKS